MGKASIILPPHELKYCGPGVEIDAMQPGDFMLTHGNAFTNKLIRFGEGLRYRGEGSKFAYWSHAAIFINSTGDLIEAQNNGVQQRHVSVYKDTEYHVIRFKDIPLDQRRNAVAFAEHCLEDRYDYMTILSLIVTLLTASRVVFSVDGQIICSTLVARALERMGAIFQYDSWHLLPADLAHAFNAVPDSSPNRGDMPAVDRGVIRHSKQKIRVL